MRKHYWHTSLHRKPQYTSQVGLLQKKPLVHCCHIWWKRLLMEFLDLFPTCQVRVVRFYQSCSPPRLAVLLLVLLLLQFLLDHVCINFHLHFRLANSWPSSLPTLFAKLFANFPAQCVPLDLNLGPSQLSVHRWTSTWDLPSWVCTAGPQWPDRIPEYMPDRVLEDMPDRMPEDMPDKMPWDMPDRMPEAMPDRNVRRYAR